MYRKTLILGLALAFLLAACGGQTGDNPANNEAMNNEATNNESMDNEAMDNENMDNDMMDDESMDDDMDNESMDDEHMDDEMMSYTFTVRIENVSEREDVLLAPGVFVVHADPGPIFTAGEADRESGLEALAEDGDPSGLAVALEGYMGVKQVGVFNTPSGADAPGPLAPGGAYEFTFTAEPHTYLSFATMFVQSNDLFYAPGEEGLTLFDEEGLPVSGEVTELVFLWDAGTEVNEAPFEGANQAPRQAGTDTGEDENGVVQLVSDGFSYPENVLVITISAE